MIDVTADSNIYISGLVFAGLPLQFLDAAHADRFQLTLSGSLLDEILRVLRDNFLWPQTRLDELTARLDKFTQCVHPAVTLDVVKDDPDDNRVLECVVAGGADYIISGDRHLLQLTAHAGIAILTARRFLEALALPRGEP